MISASVLDGDQTQRFENFFSVLILSVHLIRILQTC